MELWHISFEELVSTHTSGQLVMLIDGHNIWQKLQLAAMNSSSDEPEVEEPPKKRKHKPFKEMTSEEYEDYQHGAGF